MADRITRWTPDTCGCTIDFVYGEGDALIETRVVTACPRHRQARGDDVSAENRRKNAAVNLAAQELGLDAAEARARVRWTMTDRGDVEIELDSDPPAGLAGRLAALGATMRVRRP